MFAKLGIKRAGVSQRITTPELIKIFGLDRLDDVERKWMIEQIHEVKKSIKYKDRPQYTIRISNSRNSKKFINLVKKEVKKPPEGAPERCLPSPGCLPPGRREAC